MIPDYERAGREGKRVFYEKETATIRQYPENYCLAYFAQVETGFRWVAFKDEGSKKSRARIQFILDMCSAGMTGEAIAERMERELFPKKGKR